MKKIFVFVAVTVLTISAFTGCNKPSDTKQQQTITQSSTQTSSQTSTPTNAPIVETVKQNETTQSNEKKEASWKGILYFSDSNALYVVKEEREMKSQAVNSGKIDTAEKAKVTVEELIKGPKTKDLMPSIPSKTKVKLVTLDKDTIILDLSTEFVSGNPGGSTGEIMSLAPIVLALTELEGVKQVSFKIDGNSKSEFKGHLTLDKPFTRAEFEQYIKK